MYIYIYIERERERESEGQRSLAYCSPWDRRVRHDLAIEQQQQLLRWVGKAAAPYCPITLLPTPGSPEKLLLWR